ncbi:hypothetical protein [Clostridium vincentii]|uniref:B box-type domain-containing protein n=1 Tax=Clostridium vincentii TaxID=52704 RepID=A0A2T0BDX5_9CLOT|nr:hypothetical protein [Clostridium vincentii]PRR82089.1 hypothetical protein CLVI_20240 [Clostridium vincentii]
MKCSNHYERDAVAQCHDCGKGLCPECTNKFSLPICDKCALNRINVSKQLLVKNSIIMVVLFAFGFYLADGQGFFGRFFMGYFFAGIAWGWSFLNKITPSIFLFMSWFGWAMYFFVKLFLSMLIGMFITPYKIYKVVKGLKEGKALQIYTNSISL